MKKSKSNAPKLELKKDRVLLLGNTQMKLLIGGKEAPKEPPLQHPMPSWTATVLSISLLICSN